MTDSLRDRIAAAIYNKEHPELRSLNPNPWSYEVADAVIAALGAQPQWRNDFYIETGIPPAWYTGPIRYVTDWETA